MEIAFIVGRILFGGYFIRSGINHFRHIQGMAGYAGSKGVPMPKLAVGFTGILLLLGGLSILTGVQTVIGIILLIVFIVPITFMMHAHWNETDPMAKMGESVNFYKNLALLGALLMMLALPLPWAATLW